MGTRANILIVEKNGDWERTSQVYRHSDGCVNETGKDLAVLAYMAKEHSYSSREDFKRIRNSFLNYLSGLDSYEFESRDDGVHGDIEFLYLVKLERLEDRSVEVTIKYLETPMGFDRDEYVKKILNGEGTEITLAVEELK